MIDTGTPWLSSKMAEKRSDDSIVWRPARLAWWNASLNTSFVAGATRSSRPGKRRQHVQMLFERLQDLVRVQLEVAHHLGEGVPFDLREREEDVLVGQQGVIAAPRFLDGAIDDPLGRFADLALCDVEVVHAASPPGPISRRTRRVSLFRSLFKIDASTTLEGAGRITPGSNDAYGGLTVESPVTDSGTRVTP